jgi:RsmE family RNA methyltransferase
VVRIRPKDKVWLFDEHGNDYLARVDEIRNDRTQLTVIERRVKDEPRVKITLAQALLKSKKMDFILRKSAE